MLQPFPSSIASPCRLPCYVFSICLLTNRYQKYKSVEWGDQLCIAQIVKSTEQTVSQPIKTATSFDEIFQLAK